jgi:hypothetical protein
MGCTAKGMAWDHGTKNRVFIGNDGIIRMGDDDKTWIKP